MQSDLENEIYMIVEEFVYWHGYSHSKVRKIIIDATERSIERYKSEYKQN